MTNHEALSPEVVYASIDYIESKLKINFATFLKNYQEKNADQPELSAADLVMEILQAGYEILEAEATEPVLFDDALLVGAQAMGEDLNLFT